MSEIFRITSECPKNCKRCRIYIISRVSPMGFTVYVGTTPQACDLLSLGEHKLSNYYPISGAEL